MSKEDMEAAAATARDELEKLTTTGDGPLLAVHIVAWWRDHYPKAGHKRLGRILLEVLENKS